VIHKNPQEEQPGTAFVEILISDSGVGIPADKLETIFNPFFTTKPNGLGLGLSIVYRIIEEHSGDIRVTSRPSRGTQFCIYLPTGVFQ
jgi:signal transduction histidine kinase